MSKRKVHFIGLIAVAILFVGTIFVRADHFGRDLGGRLEWITAHSLITMEIWDEYGGPSEFGFNPVYSYPERVNFSRRAMGGVTDENGLHYYTSYPPFAFIFGYYSTQLMGGPTIRNIRILGYIIHFSCGLLLFLILYEFKTDKSKFNLSGLAAAGMYFYSTGFLWGHGFLFFSDILEQLLIIALLYIITRFLKDRFTNLKIFYALLFVLFFLACYTEWLGLFLAFFTGISALIIFFIKKKKTFLYGFLIIAFSSSLAIGTAVLQYSSIAGWDQLVEVSAKKYEIRSGRATDNPANKLTVDNKETHSLLERHFAENYKTLQNLIGAFGILFIPFIAIRRFRHRMSDALVPVGILVLLLLSIGLHYYLFYNFNALHGFSGMKSGAFIVLLISVLIMYIFHSLPDIKFQWIAGIIIGGFITFKMVGELSRYETYAESDFLLLADPARQIGELQQPEKGVFVNKPFHPINTYYSKRDWFRAMDTSVVSGFMDFFKIEEADYFVVEDNQLKEQLECVKKNGDFQIVNRKFFNP